MSELTGLFKNRYPHLRGHNWINQLADEDKQVLVDLGLQAALWGHLGGVARSKTAPRDEYGRFTSTRIIEEERQREAEEERILHDSKEYSNDPLFWEPLEHKTPEQLLEEDMAWLRQYLPQV
jgi:hypothetical protein